MSATTGHGRRTTCGTPGPRGNPVFGSMRDFQRDKLSFIRSLTRYGDVARYRMAHLTWYQVNHPDGVRRVLQENNRNYGKGSLTLGVFKPVLGQGLLSGGEREDLLALLMEARDEAAGEAMSDRQLRDEVITLFLAGHETTANILSWAFHLLSTHPEVEGRLLRELDGVLGTDGRRRTPTIEDLSKLTYTRMVVDETMRLYPPAWITNRQALAEDEILGHCIPAGAFVMVSPYVLHRHPDYWVDPDAFDPERFAPGEGRPRFAYSPFGGGPRQCIGQSMALVDAQLGLATVLGRCRLRPTSGRPVEPEGFATLRPRGGLPMTAEAA